MPFASSFEVPLVAIRRYRGFDQVPVEQYQGILIDLDDTLYSYRPCHRCGLEAAFAECGMGVDRETFFHRYRAARDAVTARLASQGACRSRLFAFQLMSEETGLARPYLTALALDRAYWTAFLSVMKPDRAAASLLDRCREIKRSVVVVTDMTAHVQIEKLQRLGLVDYVEHIVTSEEVGSEKPSRKMFEAALQKIGVPAHRALMVGDHVDKDMEGAAALGIDGALIALQEAA